MLGGGLFGGAGPSIPQCSRAGCREDATQSIHWRNPKIHGIDRVKVWGACDEHVEFLSEFLRTRDFPVVVTPLGETVESVGVEGP
ncbi:hypothetical protein [Frondihabitans cladoniiphilus]|uniref:Acetone carboxylase n=1 Tax=Frondihabitans cladoniiphilus TaxID=715785 RepID=A0ABP8W7B2_9MICO